MRLGSWVIEKEEKRAGMMGSLLGAELSVNSKDSNWGHLSEPWKEGWWGRSMGQRLASTMD